MRMDEMRKRQEELEGEKKDEEKRVATAKISVDFVNKRPTG